MKYDKECFNWFILFESEFIKKLKEKESYFIKLFKSNNREFGYNLTTGGEQSYFNDEVKFKISKKAIERNLKGENNPFFGKRHSEEQKKKWSIDRKETNKGKENSFFGKHHSKETIELMKNICREKFKDKNVIENMRNSKKNSKKIICLNNGIIYKSISEAARQLNIGKGIIQSQLHNRQKKAKGYMFKFVE
jgi:group I intron endonuclease